MRRSKPFAFACQQLSSIEIEIGIEIDYDTDTDFDSDLDELVPESNLYHKG